MAISSDKELFISKWDAVTGDFLGDFKIDSIRTEKVTKSENYACVTEPGNVCVSSNIYISDQIINPGENGVLLAWQRCCRNSIIDNIIYPIGTGFTAWTKIPPTNKKNSSPFFTALPPVFVCLDAPLVVSQAAIDPDGDSLVYSLTTPYLGGAYNSDQERPSSLEFYDKPPFKKIRWSGGYSEFNQVPGSPSFYINRQTGILSVTPSKIGVFVIGILVEEYRDGQLFGETRRDYQLNVIDCNFNVLANLSLENGVQVNGQYSLACSDSVKLKNLSVTESNISEKYFWDFGDPTTNTDTLTTFDKNIDVEYIYPGNGDYTVTLTVTSKTCDDTYKHILKVRSDRPFDLGLDKIFCGDFTCILDSYTPDALEVSWSNGAKSIRTQVSDTGKYDVLVSYGKCSYRDTIGVYIDPVPEFSIPSDSLFCDSVHVVLDVGVSDLRYQWSTGANDTLQSVKINQAGIYNVAVSNELCTAYAYVNLSLADKEDIDDAFYCNQFQHVLNLSHLEAKGVLFLWSNNSTNSETTYSQKGLHWVETTQQHCIHKDTFLIANSVIDLDLGQDFHSCDTLNVMLDGGPDGVMYNWNTGEATRAISVSSPGVYIVEVEDSSNCFKADTIDLTLSLAPKYELGSDTTICVNSPLWLTGPSDYSYLWSTGEIEQQIVTSKSGLYILTITDSLGCTGADSLSVNVDPGALPSDLYVPNSFTPNEDGLNEYFPYKIPVKQLEYHLEIYSRWGEKIFDSNKSESGNWNGYYKGRRVPQETFMYQMQYRGCDGNVRNKSGTVHVLYN